MPLHMIDALENQNPLLSPKKKYEVQPEVDEELVLTQGAVLFPRVSLIVSSRTATRSWRTSCSGCKQARPTHSKISNSNTSKISRTLRISCTHTLTTLHHITITHVTTDDTHAMAVI